MVCPVCVATAVANAAVITTAVTGLVAVRLSKPQVPVRTLKSGVRPVVSRIEFDEQPIPGKLVPIRIRIEEDFE